MKSSLPQNSNVVDGFADAVALLPPLPRVITYEDDYDDKVRSINPEDCLNSLTLYISGQKQNLRFNRFELQIRPLVRLHFLSCMMEMAPSSVRGYFYWLSEISSEDIKYSVTCEPIRLKESWSTFSAKYSNYALISLKRLLTFLCRVRFLAWTPQYSKFVSSALQVKALNINWKVRSGDAFLSIEEEAMLVRWMDEAAVNVQGMSKADCELACLVVCSYQFGMRPTQLGILRKGDCSVRTSHEDNSSIVHLTFRMIKQRDTSLKTVRLDRKVKREWAPLFVMLMNHKIQDSRASFFFGFSSSTAVGTALKNIFAEILTGDSGRHAYDLRHSMAQRLVDSGAGHEELAAAMGHTSLKTGSVYFRASANQAELMNKALGISETYKTVVNIAKYKYISNGDLAALKGDQQVAGVPHGIPIAGIGGCKTGQALCPYNPVTACYGCPKFMPVKNLVLHEQVLKDFRRIVHIYKDAGRSEIDSPAFLQLQRTISEVQGVIRELGVNDAE